MTWFAMDFSEDEHNGLLEKLAVRFKLAETKDEFKKIFEDSQIKLKDGPKKGPIVEKAKLVKNDDEDEDGEYEDEETADDDQSDDSDNIMFERVCELREIVKDAGREEDLGSVVLKILYDDDVYGAKIVAVRVPDENEPEESANGDEVYLCNHIIAMQTSVDVDEESRRCAWSGLDFSVDPPRYRKFVAIFPEADGDYDPQMDFVSTFHEGKELAEQSEILEQPNSAGIMNPEDMIYGQGADYNVD